MHTFCSGYSLYLSTLSPLAYSPIFFFCNLNSCFNSYKNHKNRTSSLQFGYSAYAYIRQDKLQLRAKKCILLGYPEGVKGYKLWCTEEDSKKVINSRDVTFNELEMPLHKKVTHNSSTSYKEPNVEILSQQTGDRRGSGEHAYPTSTDTPPMPFLQCSWWLNLMRNRFAASIRTSAPFTGWSSLNTLFLMDVIDNSQSITTRPTSDKLKFVVDEGPAPVCSGTRFSSLGII